MRLVKAYCMTEVFPIINKYSDYDFYGNVIFPACVKMFRSILPHYTELLQIRLGHRRNVHSQGRWPASNGFSHTHHNEVRAHLADKYTGQWHYRMDRHCGLYREYCTHKLNTHTFTIAIQSLKFTPVNQSTIFSMRQQTEKSQFSLTCVSD